MLLSTYRQRVRIIAIQKTDLALAQNEERFQLVTQELS
jgi:hypothetical protein